MQFLWIYCIHQKFTYFSLFFTHSPVNLKCFPSTEPGAFWPMLQCFVVLLERLGDRMWQIPAFNYQPEQLFKIMTVNCFFRNAVKQWQSDNEDEETFSQKELGDSQTETLDRLSCLSDTKYSRGFCKTALAWFQPFVESLLDFDSGKDCLSLVIEYLHGVAG